MAFIPAVNVAQANIQYRVNTDLIENTLSFYNGNAWSQAGLEELANDLLNWCTTSLLPLLSNQIRLEQVVVTDLTSQISLQATAEAGPNANGSVVADMLPNNCALCLSFRSAYRGRSARGRNYVAGIPETQHSNSLANATWAGQVRDAYEQILTIGPQNASTWVVVSRYSNNQPRSTAVFLPVVSVILTDLIIDSQRRRTPGRGT